MDKKICGKCGLEKDVSEYNLAITTRDGFSNWCKSCKSEYHKKYRLNNREKLNELNIKWRKNNKLYVSKYNKKYTEENPDIARVGRNICISRKKQLPSTLTVGQWNKCKEYFDNKCAYCGEEKKLEQDHFIPLSKGGGYTKYNIIPSCRSCNSSKNNKKFDYWYHKQTYYSIDREQKIYDFFSYIKGEHLKGELNVRRIEERKCIE